jgi:hypothetical protein
LPPGESRSRFRELLFGVRLGRELSVDVPVEEERSAADDGDGEHPDDDHRGDHDRDPRFPAGLAHFGIFRGSCADPL